MFKALIALIAVTFAVVASAGTCNIRDFGAAGDGIADDYPALKAAEAALRRDGGGELVFPAGQYRIATESHAALELRQISGVTVRFEPGAVLLMDNLRADGMGGGHGVVVSGPAHDITLDGVTVVWKTLPAGRSHGDAFRFDGFPSEEGTVRGVRLLDCRAEKSPQTGAVFMGVSDIEVRNFVIRDNLADALHFNACRNISVDGVEGVNNGDDTLAFVTYWAEEFEGECGTVFSLPELCEWSNSNARARNIKAVGGHANGVRISGSRDVQVEHIDVRGKSCGVIIDSGLADMERFHWSYQPSRDIVIKDLTAVECNSGFFVWCFSPDVPGFTDFRVSAEDLTLVRNENDNLHLWDGDNVTLKDIDSEHGRIRLRGFRNLAADGIDLSDGYLFVMSQYDLSGDHSDLRDASSRIDGVEIERGFAFVKDCRDLTFADWSIEDAPESALAIHASEDLHFSGVNIERPGRSGSGGAVYGLQLAGCGRTVIDGLRFEADDTALIPLEIGGGGPAYRPRDLTVRGVLKGNLRPDPIVVQSGPYAPENLQLEVTVDR